MGANRPSAALFGGTFDPFHTGHLRMAIEVREALSLPRVVLLPAHHPPHKPGQPVSAARHRLAMASAAVRASGDSKSPTGRSATRAPPTP